MNILILSAGTRNKIIQYFKQELGNTGKVIATDMSELAPAIYEADKYYIVPKISSPDYIDIIIDICKKEKIDGVLSLIDPELSLIAQHEEIFGEINVQIIGSSYELCERAIDKMEMYKWLKEKNYNCAQSYADLNDFLEDTSKGVIKYPVFVKPIKGSASLSTSKVYNKETLILLFNSAEKLMVQEFLDGQEIGADVYVDLISGEVVSIFTKKKLAMRAGETDKAVSFVDEKLMRFIRRFVKESGYKGQIDIDLFEIDGEYYISEVNPRFGGGYPHAYECGCNHIKLICNNLLGVANRICIGDYKEGIFMMKYNEIAIKSTT